jgi:hypothetical protein
MELKRFRHTMKDIATHDHLPDYSVAFDEERDVVIFQGRGTIIALGEKGAQPIPPLKSETYGMARAAAPGWDIHVLEQEWRAWVTESPQNPDAAFVGFCKTRFAKVGQP